MYSALAGLIDRLDSPVVARTHVIRWGCPVPSFGDLATSQVATLGLNPSNREFVDESGNELLDRCRRFHTLRSLGLRSWSEADTRHLQMILGACAGYFKANPYDRWFKILDRIISGAGVSYYSPFDSACHLDLIPYATARKWAELTAAQRSALLAAAGDALGLLLRDSPVRMLVLNGKSVVHEFQDVAGVCLDRYEMLDWSLPRQSGPCVKGVSYRGVVDSVAGVMLGRQILVLGFNHNLQSSFGVTTDVITRIGDWVTRTSEEFFL